MNTEINDRIHENFARLEKYYATADNFDVCADAICRKIKEEYRRARAKHPPFHSTHEAYGVILEELDEWWDSVKRDEPDDAELISVAAMCITAVIELQGKCCTEEPSGFKAEDYVEG